MSENTLIQYTYELNKPLIASWLTRMGLEDASECWTTEVARVLLLEPIPGEQPLQINILRRGGLSTTQLYHRSQLQYIPASKLKAEKQPRYWKEPPSEQTQTEEDSTSLPEEQPHNWD